MSPWWVRGGPGRGVPARGGAPLPTRQPGAPRPRPRATTRPCAGAWRRSAPAACLALLAACREAPPQPQPTITPEEREARELVAQARREVEQESPPAPDLADQLYVPRASGNVPLLIFLHGLGGSGAALAQQLELRAFAEAAPFAFMAPEGARDFSGRRFWNASASCCNFSRLKVDHVAQLRDWILDAVKRPQVDPKRVYLVGYSNGGFMAYRAACEIGDLLRGIVSIAGAGASGRAECHPTQPLSVVQIHGDADPIVAFEGGYLFADRSRPSHPSAEASLRPWVRFDGCAEKAVSARTLDLDPRIPGGETEVFAYPGCAGRRVELWRIHGGDHSAGLSRYSLDAIWKFILADSGG